LEQWLCRSVAQVWCCSEIDKGHLVQSYSDTAPIHAIPNSVDINEYQRPESMHRDSSVVQKKYLFVGNYNYAPNVAAAYELVHEIMPYLMEQVPAAHLALVGRGVPEELSNLGQGSVEIFGQVADVRPYYWEAEALLVPLRHGSGTRLKIIEAMAAGCPVISTSLGAEGLDVVNGVDILYAENADEFAQQVRRLAEDQVLRMNIVRAARDLVQRLYSHEAVGVRIEAALQAGGLL